MQIREIKDNQLAAKNVGVLIKAAVGPMAETLTGFDDKKQTKQQAVLTKRFWCKINKIVFVIHWDDC
ncbi:hypothetical protein [Periweissella beninensis]|uniref:Uncharacterized protein n=1 Tax=Periweissella beninensis TaxID=504936 RepID=A0ABT0VGK2_9LACO|nr:hypothetical protein [Periweissella beninensis]MBM7544745.1 hypothetical protein [Periweissella beninensis]MCM2436963.1 hypothetical protein [Periweissella beninensis]MCT4396499.1 hypothetical protein [Periweissella beninensis]